MIMYIRNNSFSQHNGSSTSSHTLVYDRKQYARGSVASSQDDDGRVSVVSAAQSDTSFVGRVKTKWGDEESELRQAIFFQFIKTKSVIGSEDVLESVVSSLDRSIHEDRNNYGIIDDTTYSKLSGGKKIV